MQIEKTAFKLQFQARKSSSPSQHDYIMYRVMYIMCAQNCSVFTFMLSVPNTIWIDELQSDLIVVIGPGKYFW